MQDFSFFIPDFLVSSLKIAYVQDVSDQVKYFSKNRVTRD